MLSAESIRRARTLFSWSTSSARLTTIACMWAFCGAVTAGAMEGVEEDRLLQQLTPEAQEMLKKAVGLASFDYRKMPLSEQEEAHREFHLLLGVLGQPMGDSLGMETGESGEPTIKRSLIAMAVDRARNPSYYEELTRWYGVWGATHNSDGTKKTRFPHGGAEPRHLLAKHATEEYRLTWESLWVGPSSRDTGFMKRGMGFVFDYWAPDDTRLHALAKIGNTASIPVILYRTRLGTQGVNGNITHALAYFYTEEALRGILECLSIWDSSPNDDPVLIGDRTLREHVVRMFTDPLNRGENQDEKVRLLRVAKWREVIERFPKDDLPPDQRKLLEQVLAFERETDEETKTP